MASCPPAQKVSGDMQHTHSGHGTGFCGVHDPPTGTRKAWVHRQLPSPQTHPRPSLQLPRRPFPSPVPSMGWPAPHRPSPTLGKLPMGLPCSTLLLDRPCPEAAHASAHGPPYPPRPALGAAHLRSSHRAPTPPPPPQPRYAQPPCPSTECLPLAIGRAHPPRGRHVRTTPGMRKSYQTAERQGF